MRNYMKSTDLIDQADHIHGNEVDGRSTFGEGDPVNHPAHYTAGRIECIDALESMAMGYADPVLAGLAWQVVKYVWRCPLKGKPAQDARKAEFYLKRLIGRLEEAGDENH